MALQTMYSAKPNSPQTTLTAQISADATTLTVYDGSVLPSAPNLLTLGTDENAEVVYYTTLSGNTVSGLVRGYSGTTASVWAEGTQVSREYTSYDHDTFINNINDLETNKQDKLTFDSTPTASSTNPVTSDGIKTALDAKQNTLTFDDTPTASSSNPVKSSGIKSALDDKVKKSGDTMTGNLIISGENKTLRFVPDDTSKMSLAQIYIRNKEQLVFWCMNANGGNELYALPVVNQSATGNNYYDILTGKNSGVKTLSGSAFTGTLSYQTIGKFGMISGQIKLAADLTAAYIDLQTIPDGSRPSTVICGLCGGQAGWGVIYIYKSGVIRFFKAQNTSWSAESYIYFSFSYFVA